MRLLITLLLLFTTTLFANIAKITAIKGDATVLRDSKTLNLNIGFLLEEKDQITTSKNARLQLQFQDKTVISLGKDSVFNIEEYFFDEQQAQKTKASFKVPKGIFKSITGRIGKINPSKFQFKTKSASIGIRGTVFFGKVTPVTPGRPPVPDQIACTSGRIIVTSSIGSKIVPAGFMTTVSSGKQPTILQPLTPVERKNLNVQSGASQSEKESGKTEQSVEQEKQQPVQEEPTQQTTDEGGTTETNSNTETTPTVTTVETPDTNVADDAVDNATTASTEATETANTVVTDEASTATTNTITQTVTTTSSLKTATYNVYHSAEIDDSGYKTQLSTNGVPYYSWEPIYGSQYDTAGTVTSRGTININDGQLSGSSTVYLYNEYGGTALDYFTTDGIQDSITTSYLSTIPVLAIPETTYTGVNHIYKYTENGVWGDATYGGNSKNIYVDSKQEFFVAVEDTWENTNYDGSTYIDANGVSQINDYYQTYHGEYQTIAFGEKANYSVLPSTGISTYIFPEDVYYYASSTGMTQTYGLDAASGFAGSDNVYNFADIFNQSDFFTYIGYDYYNYYTSYELSTYTTYVNWANKNLLDYRVSLYYDNNSLSFIADGNIALGQISSDTSGKAKVNLNMIDFWRNTYYDSVTNTPTSTDIYMKSTNSDFYIFGSEYQGIGGTTTYTDTTNNISYEDTYGAFRAKGLAMESTITPTGTSTFNGFTAYNEYGSPTSALMSFDLDRTNGIAGSISGSSISVNIGGTLGTDAAYITDDTFATLNLSGTTDGSNTINYGWLVANDTDIYTQTASSTDDGISWGIWGVNTDTSYYSQFDVGFWVAGVNRVEDMIADLGSTFQGTYTGNVMGIIEGYTSGTYDVLDTLNSTMTLGFDFGAGTIDATLNAVTASNTAITAAKNFRSTDFTTDPSTYIGTTGTDQIMGSFYNNGASTAGSFTFDVNGDTVSGVYKALKQ